MIDAGADQGQCGVSQFKHRAKPNMLMIGG